MTFEEWADSVSANRVTADHQHLINVREIAHRAWDAASRQSDEYRKQMAQTYADEIYRMGKIVESSVGRFERAMRESGFDDEAVNAVLVRLEYEGIRA